LHHPHDISRGPDHAAPKRRGATIIAREYAVTEETWNQKSIPSRIVGIEQRFD
jgi:hypothetical protein